MKRKMMSMSCECCSTRPSHHMTWVLRGGLAGRLSSPVRPLALPETRGRPSSLRSRGGTMATKTTNGWSRNAFSKISSKSWTTPVYFSLPQLDGKWWRPVEKLREVDGRYKMTWIEKYLIVKMLRKTILGPWSKDYPVAPLSFSTEIGLRLFFRQGVRDVCELQLSHEDFQAGVSFHCELLNWAAIQRKNHTWTAFYRPALVGVSF